MEFWSAIQGAGLGAVALAILLGAAKMLWDAKTRAESKEADNRNMTIATHETRLAGIDKEINGLRIQLSETQKDFGRLDQTMGKFNEKLDGLQQFWRGEFEKLSDKMTQGMDRLRLDVRKDFEEHRAIVHERMGEATRNMIATVEQVLSKQNQRRSK